jgi:putative PIN family toxin of toxin-antitoxin system
VIRALIDTNVLASGIVMLNRAEGPPVTILRLARRRAYKIVTCEAVINELQRTLEKPYFAAVISEKRRARAIALLSRVAEAAVVTDEPERIATHPEDDLILAAAVSANVDYLVTGDRQLLALGDDGGVRIVSPAAFLALLEAAPDRLD